MGKPEPSKNALDDLPVVNPLEDFDKIPPRDHQSWATPVYQQFWEIQDDVRNRVDSALLFFRLGDFYELFGKDAVVAAPLMEVQLTSRDKKSGSNIPMCGVPAHAWESYAQKILSRGHKVALAEQITEPGDPKHKMVQRALKRIITPGLPCSYQHLDAKQGHWIVCVSKRSTKELELVFLDFLESRLFVEVLPFEKLADCLWQWNPAEILIAEDEEIFERDFLLGANGLWVERVSRFGSAYQGSLDNLRDYVRLTQKWDENELQKYWPELQDSSEKLRQQKWAEVSDRVLEQWNVNPELFEFFDSCSTAGGSRSLRQLMRQPLCENQAIIQRQGFLKEFESWERFLKSSQKCLDVKRLLGRLRVGAAHPSELIKLYTSVARMKRAFDGLNEIEKKNFLSLCQFEWDQNELLADSNEIVSYLKRCEKLYALEGDFKKGSALQSLLKPDCDENFQKLHSEFSDSQDWLNSFESRLREELDIPKLKVRFNKVFGFYIEVSKTQAAKVPENFERKQSMVNAERFTCQELKDKEQFILNAETELEKVAQALLATEMSRVLESSSELMVFFEQFSRVDAFAGVLKSVAKQKRFGSWTYPELVEGKSLFFEFRELRHPLVQLQNPDFVENDLAMGEGESPIMLLTGPNMAGKSTLMRQCGLAFLMGQYGFPIPATRAKFVPAEKFFSRMGASDRILHGESTFMVEMQETAELLKGIDAKSFVLVDEVGRGTSSGDGLALARAILEFLDSHVGGCTIFATHYHELAELGEKLGNVRNSSMQIKHWKGQLHFMRKLIPEPARSSYGIAVAKMAGVPEVVYARAQKLLQQPMTEIKSSASSGSSTGSPSGNPSGSSSGIVSGQIDLFNQVAEGAESSESSPKGLEGDPLELEQQPLVEHLGVEESRECLLEIEGMDVDDLSPREAWKKLADLQKKLRVN